MNPALKRLSEIEQSATKAPWEVITSRDVFPAVIAPMIATIATDFESLSDASFVSHARKAMPALIAALVEIEATCDRLEASDFLREHMTCAEIREIINRHLAGLEEVK